MDIDGAVQSSAEHATNAPESHPALMTGAITSLIKGRLPHRAGGLPRRGRPWQNVPLTLVHTSSARARPSWSARFWAQPSPRPHPVRHAPIALG